MPCLLYEWMQNSPTTYSNLTMELILFSSGATEIYTSIICLSNWKLFLLQWLPSTLVRLSAIKSSRFLKYRSKCKRTEDGFGPRGKDKYEGEFSQQ